MLDVKQELIKLGNTNPELRDNISVVLDRMDTMTEATTPKVASTGQDILQKLVDQQGLRKVLSNIDRDDLETRSVLSLSIRALAKALNLDNDQTAALNRLTHLAYEGERWDAALVRNNVFKIAILLGIKTPSSSF